MSITLHFDYKFELDGKVYEGIGAEFADTEKEEDINTFRNDIEGGKISAICDAFDLCIEEYEERADEFARVKFDEKYFDVYSVR